MLNTDQGALVENRLANVRTLYDKHAGMLLGYIFEVVKDRKLAEDYLVKIFCGLSQQFEESDQAGVSTWCQLQRFAKDQLSDFNKQFGQHNRNLEAGLVKQHAQSKYIARLTEEQRKVFCGVYYYGQHIADISKELNKTEDLIRKTLKEAFAIMRESGEN